VWSRATRVPLTRGVGMPLGRATNGATKLSECSRTELAGDGLSKPQPHQLASFGRYRTQEVAGSSPASSMNKIPAKRKFL
jgi:hypothetical protein